MGMSLLITAFILQTASSITYEGWTTVWVRQLAFLVLASILLWSLYRFQTRLRTLAICIIVLLAVDLYLVGVNSLDRQPGSPSIYWPVPDWLEQLQAEDPGRIDTGFHFYANVGEIYNLENTSGISPLKLRWVADFERLPTVRRWQLLNVTHIVSASPPSEANLTPLTEVREPLVPDHGINATLYRFEDSLPRAWMSYQPVFVTGADEALAILHDQAFDPSTQVVVDTISTNIEAFQQIITAATPPVITISRPNSSRLQLEVETEQPGILVISEWNYPGWRATVNGGSTPILSVNYALQGLQLPAGHHTITLRFQPATVIVGLFISLITLFASGLVARRWQTAVSKSPIRKKSANRFPLINSHAKRLSTITVNYRYYAIALILLGFALRIFLLGEQELRGDEAFSYLFARQPVNQIIPTLLSEGDPHSPLHYLLLHGWMRLAGSTEFAMRYISLIPSLLLVPLMMRLGAELWDKRLGLIAAGLFTISQSLIWLAQDTRNQYTLALFFGAISTVVLIRASRNKWSTLKKQDWSLWTLYIVSTALTVYSHYYGIFPLIAHGLYLWFSPGKRPYLPVWLISSFAAGLLFLPWTLVSWRGLVGAGQLSDPAQPELAHYLTVVGLEMVTGPAFSSWIGRWLFLICVFLSIYGSLYLAKRAPGWNALLVSWLLITALGVYLVQFQRATFNPFYISIASPAWWLLLSSGLYALWQKQDLWRLAAPIGLSAIIVTSGIALFNYYTKPEYRRSIGYRDIAAHLEAEAKPDDVFVAHFPDPSLDYYLRDLPLPRRMIPVRMNAPANETEHSLAELAATFERIWFVPAHFSVWDPENIAFRWLNYHNLKEWELDYYRLSLFGYRPQHALSKSVAPIGLETETVGRIRLQSAFISVNGSPVNVGDTLEIKSGDAINVTLIWENFSPVPERYAVFVHLLGEDGGLIAQHDGVPLFGTRPTDTWLPGEQLVDWHEIVVSDAGRVENGTIMVGLYHQQTLDRQRFVGIGDAYQLRSVRFVD
jgi:mannosyltransferase